MEDASEPDRGINEPERVAASLRAFPETWALIDAWAERLSGRRGRKMSRMAVLEDLLLRARVPDDAAVRTAYGSFVERLGAAAPGWNVERDEVPGSRYPLYDGGCAHGSARVISGATPLRRCDGCRAVEGVDGVWRVVA